MPSRKRLPFARWWREAAAVIAWRSALREMVLLALGSCLVLALPASAQPVNCDPVPRQLDVLFEPRTITLTSAQQEQTALWLSRVIPLRMNYTLVEPRVALMEGSEAERRQLALHRGDYLKNLLATAGVEPEKIEITLTHSLEEMGPGDHPVNRTTGVSVFAIDDKAYRKCVDGR